MLYHDITSGNIKYLTGDSVYFNRLNSNQWHSPAKVLGQDGQQVLVKNGSSYHHRIHSSRLHLINNRPQPNNVSQSNKHKNTYAFNKQSISAENEQQSYDTDSEFFDNPENDHNAITFIILIIHIHHSSYPIQPSYPSEKSIQPPYKPECSLQSSHSFETTTQRSHSSQSSQPEILKPNISSQHSQSIKKVKTTPHHKIQTNNDSNRKDAEIINPAGKATGKYSNC